MGTLRLSASLDKTVHAFSHLSLRHYAAFFISIPLLALLSLIARKLLDRAAFDRTARKYGAHQPKNLATLQDPILGLDYMVATIKAAKNARYLPFMWERFKQFGYTYVTRRLLYDTVHAPSTRKISRPCSPRTPATSAWLSRARPPCGRSLAKASSSATATNGPTRER